MPFDGTTIHEQRTLADELVRARLRYARTQIAAGRWCQYLESDDNGNHCLIGWAKHPAVPHIGIYAIRQLWLALPKSAQHLCGWCSGDVARYNDTHTRNAVIKLLNRAIDAA